MSLSAPRPLGNHQLAIRVSGGEFSAGALQFSTAKRCHNSPGKFPRRQDHRFSAPEQKLISMPNRQIGKSVPRIEGRDKVTGAARYVDDLAFPGMIYGVTVRSTAARGNILAIRFHEEIPWHEFTIVTAQDIPGKNCVALLIEDQPCLADQQVNHPEEAVVLLAHPDKYLLEKARQSVQIDIEPLPAVHSIDDSLSQKQIIWGEDNIFKSYQVEKGDVDTAWSAADFIVDGDYETGAQEQLYIEPQGIIARANPTDGVR